MSAFHSGRTFYKMRETVEKYKSERIKMHYRLRLLHSKAASPLNIFREIFPVQNFTQPLDHFDPEVQVSKH